MKNKTHYLDAFAIICTWLIVIFVLLLLFSCERGGQNFQMHPENIPHELEVRAELKYKDPRLSGDLSRVALHVMYVLNDKNHFNKTHGSFQMDTTVIGNINIKLGYNRNATRDTLFYYAFTPIEQIHAEVWVYVDGVLEYHETGWEHRFKFTTEEPFHPPMLPRRKGFAGE